MSRKDDVLARIRATFVVPVVRAPSAALALDAVEATLAGGIDVVEITMTVPGATALIGDVARRFGDAILVGAGTVLDPATAEACIDAGASFVVSPATDHGTIERCRARGVAVLPGALTPTEVLGAHRAGADVVKIFPCGTAGGPAYLRALKAPFPWIEMMPTGGASLATAADFVRAGAFALGAGSDLVDVGLLGAGRGDEITRRARQYVEVVEGARARVRSSE